MPHLRNRHILANLKELMRFSPIVALFGHRQAGKSTLVESLTDRYFTLDLQSTVDVISQDPLAFLEANTKNGPLVLDECQLMPALFPALKEHVRKNKKPGQIILTGSVRFTGRKAIKESLTGRFIGTEILPFSWNEIEKEKLSNAAITALTAKNLEYAINKDYRISQSSIEKFLDHGSLPGFFALREKNIRKQKFLTQMQTLFERDIKLLVQTTLSFESIRRLGTELSRKQGAPINVAELVRSTRISAPTLKKLLNAMELMFMIRIVRNLGNEKSDSFYFEDQGEANFLSPIAPDSLKAIELFTYQMLRCQWMYRPELEVELYQWRTRNGAFIPLILSGPKHKLAIIPSGEENPSPQSIGSAGSFLRVFPQAKVLYLHLGKKDYCLSANQRSLPLGKLL